ncbi:hypothetical protein AAFC00_005277 [Neodothiora populina]|uniref:Major facilitator superfamily (MFS) profile domain-containing protein n=1 Tax=Neodothiora populina TaxID=2781224 RepID=A0ABR3PKQ5_9PEZI
MSGTSVQGFWIALSYILTDAIFQSLLATLSSSLARGRILFISAIFVTIGSVVTGTAHNMAAMIAGRVIQGFGAAGCNSLSYILPSESLLIEHQRLYTGIIEGTRTVGFILGGLVGAVFAQHTSWRWIFLFNLPFCGVALLLVPFALSLRNVASPQPLLATIYKLDLIGTLLFAISFTLFLIAMTGGGIAFAWKSPSAIWLIVLGILGLLITGAWEVVGASEPFMRHRLFYRRVAKLGYLSTFIQGFVLYPQIFFIPLYLSATHSTTLRPVAIAASLLALMIAIVPSYVLASRYLRIPTPTAVPLSSRSVLQRIRYKIVNTVLPLPLTLLTITTSRLLALTSRFPVALPAVLLIILGLTHGLLLSRTETTIRLHANNADMTRSVLMSNFIRSAGPCLGLGLSVSTCLNTLKHSLSQHSAANSQDQETIVTLDALAPHALELLSSLPLIPETWESKVVIVDAYSRACRAVWVLLLAVCGSVSFFVICVLFSTKTSFVVGGGPQQREQMKAETTTTEVQRPGNISRRHGQQESPRVPQDAFIAGPEYRSSTAFGIHRGFRTQQRPGSRFMKDDDDDVKFVYLQSHTTAALPRSSTATDKPTAKTRMMGREAEDEDETVKTLGRKRNKRVRNTSMFFARHPMD